MWRSVLALLLVPSIAWAQEKSLQVSEKQETVAPGEHLLRAKVTLQSINDMGVLPPQQIKVQPPVTVVQDGSQRCGRHARTPVDTRAALDPLDGCDGHRLRNQG
jgi:hypothetical protein